MDLNTFAANFKRYILPVGLVLLVIVFTVIGITNLNPKPQKEIPNPKNLPADLEFNTANLASAGIRYSFGVTSANFTNFPNQLPLYAVKFGLSDTKLKEVAQKVSLNQAPTKQQNITKYSQNAKTLAYDSSSGVLNYSAAAKGSAATITLNPEELRQLVIDFVSRLSLFPQQLQISKIVYYSGGMEPHEVPADQAKTVTVYFQITIDGYPTLTQNYLSFDGNRNLVSFRFWPFELGDKKETYTLKGFTDLVADINNRQVKITGLGGFERQLGMGQVETAHFTNVSLIYIDQPGQSLFQPGYLLTGETPVVGTLAPVAAVVAAIKGVAIKP